MLSLKGAILIFHPLIHLLFYLELLKQGQDHRISVLVTISLLI